MSETNDLTQHSRLNVNDILFILWRHKWKITVSGLVGLGAAVALHFLLPPTYESQSKLLVRYVADSSSIDKLDSPVRTLDSQGGTLINSEAEILLSEDLATQVAQAIGVERIIRGVKLQNTEDAKAVAAHSILKGLKVTPVNGTNIISVSYENKDPQLATLVLRELVNRYFDKHLEVHRSVGAFEFVAKEADQMRERLHKTEEDLKNLKECAGIVSLAESTTSLNGELIKGREELDAAQAESATQQARVREIEKSLGGSSKTQMNSAPEASSEVIRQYQALVTRVAYLRQAETELLGRYKAQNVIVKAKRAQIEDLEKQQGRLEQSYPGLVGWLPSAPAQGNRVDLANERAQAAGLQARVEALRSRLSRLQERAKLLSDFGPQIAELERRKEGDEANYKYFRETLERARVDETLDPKRLPNISIVQQPSEAVLAGEVSKKKIMLGVAAGGVAVGLMMAFGIELFFDRTIKRRLDLERRVGIPLLLSIPDFGRNGKLALRSNNGSEGALKALPFSSSQETVPWDNGHFIRPFCEAIRDRLILYFERNTMTHKPKLVAVTGCSDGAGASTIAAGIAAALSETCEGKVLLVDKPLGPRRFFNTIADFKAGNFDYVIFDMPSISDTGTTLAMASLMDKVLLIVEAEATSRDAVKRAYAELANAKANVSAVFNKTRSYGPKWLAGEL
jgi:uncharacterized protein involved in exopolysaccharide biosynthesis